MDKEYEIQKQVSPFNSWSNRLFHITQDTFAYRKSDKQEDSHKEHISKLRLAKLTKEDNSNNIVLTLTCTNTTIQLTCKGDDDKLLEIRDFLAIIKRYYSIILIDYFYQLNIEGGYNTREFKYNLSQYMSQQVVQQISNNFKKSEGAIDKKASEIWELFKKNQFDYSEGEGSDLNPFVKMVFENSNKDNGDEGQKVEFHPEDIDTVTKYFTTLMQMLVLVRRNLIECRFNRVALMDEARKNYENLMIIQQEKVKKRNEAKISNDLKAKQKKKQLQSQVQDKGKVVETKEKENKEDNTKSNSSNNESIKKEEEAKDNQQVNNEEMNKNESEAKVVEPKKDITKLSIISEEEDIKEIEPNKEQPQKEDIKQPTTTTIINDNITTTSNNTNKQTENSILNIIKSEDKSIETLSKLKEENKKLKEELFKYLDTYSKQKERLKRFIIRTHIKTYYCYNCGNLLKLIESTQPTCEYDYNCTNNSLFSCSKCKIEFCTYCIIYQRNSKCAQNHRLFHSKDPNLCLLCENSDSNSYFTCEHCNVAVCSKCMGQRQTKETNCYNCNMELTWRKEVYAQCNKCLSIKDCFWGCSNCEYSLCLKCVETNRGFCGAAHKLDKFNLETSWFDLNINAKMQFSHNLYLKFMGKCMKCDEIIEGIGHCCSRCSYFICQKCYEE